MLFRFWSVKTLSETLFCKVAVKITYIATKDSSMTVSKSFFGGLASEHCKLTCAVKKPAAAAAVVVVEEVVVEVVLVVVKGSLEEKLPS